MTGARSTHPGLLSCVVSMLVAGCGGGGGGSPQESLQGLPPLPLDQLNSQEVISVFMELGELALSFALLGIEVLDAYEQSPESAQEQAASNCTEGGTATVQLHDRDGDGVPGTGDQLDLRLQACRDEGVSFTGTVAIHIDSLSHEDGTRHALVSTRMSALQASVGTFSVDISARLDTYHQRDAASERYELTTSWLELLQPGYADRISNLAVTYEQRFDDWRFRLGMTGRVASTYLGGWFDVGMPLPLAGQLLDWPDSGEIEIIGAAPSRMVLTTLNGGFLRLLLTNSSLPEPQVIGTRSWSPGMAFFWRELLRPDAEQPPPADLLVARLVALGAPGGDVVTDPARNRFYVTVPARNELLVMSLDSLQLVDRIAVAGGPQRMRLGLDGRTLFIAAHVGGTVVARDLDTGIEQRFVISPELGSPATWDMLEYAPGRLLVTGSSGAFNYVVELDTANGASRRVAGSIIVRDEPELVQHPGDRFVYLREWNSASLLRRLDTGDVAIPVIASGNLRRSPFTAGRMVMSTDGTRLVMPDGRVVQADNFTVLEDLALRAQWARSSDQSEAWAWRLPGSGQPDRGVQVYDAQTLAPLHTWQPACGAGDQLGLAHLEAGRWAFLVGESLCLVDTQAQDDPPGAGDSPAPPGPPAALPVSSGRIFLGGVGFAMAFDEVAERAYVSLPELNLVRVIDTANVVTLATIPLAGIPRGLDLSADGSELFVALEGTGSVAVLDTASLSISESIALSSQLGTSDVWDVAEVGPGRLLVSATGVATRPVLLQRDSPGSAQALGNIPVGSRATIAVAPDRSRAFLAVTSAIPESLYSLDLSQPAPVPARRHAHGALQGLDALASSPDGGRLYTSGGQVLDVASTMPVGLVGPGAPQVTANGSDVLVAGDDGLVRRYALATETVTEVWQPGCGVEPARQLVANAGQSRWVLRQAQFLCVIEAP